LQGAISLADAPADSEIVPTPDRGSANGQRQLRSGYARHCGRETRFPILQLRQADDDCGIYGRTIRAL